MTIADTQPRICIVGCGPIGLVGALLLARMGVPVTIVERRDELNTHPRSRFVDTNTMEIMRELGVEKDVEATGLGPDWTSFNRFAVALNGHQIAAIPSPTFHTVPRETSPCLPVMTCQDYVEVILADLARNEPLIDMRFSTEASNLSQDESGVSLTLKNLKSGEAEQLRADYLVGADGPGSYTRTFIGAELDDEARSGHLQDVIFDADLSPWVEDRKGALLYAFTGAGIVIFQPLDGKRRWRCQVGIGTPDLIDEAIIRERIRIAAGADTPIEMTINSMSKWQPLPGNCTRYGKDRIFVAGDAAHIAIPAGGMGNNSGFLGMRNLAWKLALVVKGLAPETLLDSYFTEHHPIAAERIAGGVSIYEGVIGLLMAHMQGRDIDKATQGASHYAEYDGLIMGYEMASDWIAPNVVPVPANADPFRNFQPLVRNGRRAPHVWLDSRKARSVLDLLGGRYVLLAGADVAEDDWARPIATLQEVGFPIALEMLPASACGELYAPDSLTLIRPDGITADRWSVTAGTSVDQRRDRLCVRLPLTETLQKELAL